MPKATEPRHEDIERELSSFANSSWADCLVTPSAHASPDIQIGPYRVLTRLGAGSSGTVSECVDTRSETSARLAIKVWHAPADPETVALESRALARIATERVVKPIDSGVTPDGRPFMVMELVLGERLDEWLLSGPSLSERLAIMLDVCRAVRAAHEVGVLHRDLKPANIVVESDGRVRLLDFGLARVGAFSDATLYSGPERLVGTLPYMSPEQISGHAELIDQRSDVFALGVLLFRVVAGRLPLPMEGHTLNEAVAATLAARFDAAALEQLGCPAGLSGVVARAIERDPARRTPSVSVLIDEIARCEVFTTRAPSPGRLNRRVVLGAVLVGVAVLVGTALWRSSGLGGPDPAREASNAAAVTAPTSGARVPESAPPDEAIEAPAAPAVTSRSSIWLAPNHEFEVRGAPAEELDILNRLAQQSGGLSPWRHMRRGLLAEYVDELHIAEVSLREAKKSQSPVAAALAQVRLSRVLVKTGQLEAAAAEMATLPDHPRLALAAHNLEIELVRAMLLSENGDHLGATESISRCRDLKRSLEQYHQDWAERAITETEQHAAARKVGR